MTAVEVISKLSSAEISAKEEHYTNIVKLFSENVETASDGLNNEHIKNLCSIILDDLKNETVELPQLAKLIQFVFHNKYLQKFFPQSEKVEIVKNIIGIVDSSQHENILVNCFSVFIHISPFNLENSVLNDLLQRMEEILSKKNDAASTYSICCCFQKIIKDYEERLSNFIPVLSKLVFLPLCHPSTKVREVAEKTLDMFPKLLLYTSDEEASNYLIKLVKETYSRSLLLLFKDKQELYALKVWKHVVNALGSTLHTNLPGIMPFFSVLERGFKSSVDEICIASFVAWKSLINSFAATDGVLNDSKILRFTLKPFKNVARLNENVLSVVCDSWWHLAWNLGSHLSNRFSEVCIPLLELTVGKITNGHLEKTFPKGGLISKDVKKCCFMLLRFLEQPPSESFNRLSSPKKLPNIPYPALQIPLDIKIITHHFKEILHAFKIIIDVCGTKDDMKLYLDCLMKSVLFIVSTVIEDSNKESVEAVMHYLNFLSDVIEAKSYPSLLCLKSLESLSKLSRKVLVSHCFICGSRKAQDILCTTLLKMLLTPHLFPSEAPKRFFAAYNRLVQAGIYESFHALSIAHKFMHIVRNAVGGNSLDVDVLIDIWSGVATPLLEVIEKTQEVNQGDKQEHDFSCMYDVLLFPFEFIFPIYIHQFRTRPVVKLWTNLYKAFICSTSLVTTTTSNEACENFCSKLKEHLKEDLLKKPHFFETVCLYMQLVIDSMDFSFGSTSGNQGMIDVALMIKRKKPLGNLTSFIDLLALILKTYHSHYIEDDEESLQSSAPTVQRKLHIVKSAAPLDILKTFFGNLKTGSLISFILDQLVDPLSKLFLKSSQKRNFMNHVDSKLELVWNVLSSSIERYYLGPYDSEFLAVMSPLLEATFSHPKRHFKEKSRRFWFATFGPNASSLQFPESLKTVLKKMKLPLLSDDIIPTEFSISPVTDSVTEDSIVIGPPTTPKSAFLKLQPFKSPQTVNGEASKALSKENKQSPKVSIDDLPSEEFVKIETPIITTPSRRGIRKRKSFVPSLYNDLSQDTATLMSSSESQDTMNSAPLEETELKEPLVESKVTPKEDFVLPIPTSHKDAPDVSKNAVNSPMAAKFEEKLSKNIRNEKNLFSPIEIITIESPESDPESNTRNKGQETSENTSKAKAGASELFQKLSKNETASGKISVFSEPAEKRPGSRNTRRNTRLSQSFSVSKESEKLEFQKLNKSCNVLIHLSDSEEIIPSSQSSTENENSIKLSVSKNKPLSVVDECQKSLSVDYDNKNNEMLPPVCSSSEEKDTETISKDNFVEKNSEVEFITSTPLKSKAEVNEESKTLQENENFNEASKDILKVDTLSTSGKDETASVNVETLNKENESIDKEKILDEPMDSEVCSNIKDGIKDLNFLLDAVDDLIKTSSTESCLISPKLPADVEMEDLPSSESKDEATNLPKEKTDKDHKEEPALKRSRLDFKSAESDSSQTGMYSQRLRKKNTKEVIKSQPNLKKKKSTLKVTTIGKEGSQNCIKNKSNVSSLDENELSECMDSNMQASQVNKAEKNIKNSKSDAHPTNEYILSEGVKSARRTVNSNKSCKNSIKNDKNIESFNKESISLDNVSPSNKFTDLSKDIKNSIINDLPIQNENVHIEITNPNRGSDLEENKISGQQVEEKFEKSEIVNTETGHLEENSPELAIKLSLEISDRLNDNMKTSSASIHQTMNSTESCEIFETLSENSCKDLNKDMCNDMALSDSNGLVDSVLTTKEEKSSHFSEVIEEHDSPSHLLGKTSPVSTNTNEMSLKDMNEEKLEENITVIPSSLDNDTSLDTMNKITEASETRNSGGNNAKVLVITESSNLTQFASNVKCTIEVENSTESDPSAVQFSDTEDEIAREMRSIVNSIVDASCANSISSFEGSNPAESIQISGASLNKEKMSVDEKFCSDESKLKENDMKNPEASQRELSQCSEESSSNAVIAASYDSSDGITSSTPEGERQSADEILENSIEMDIEHSDTSIENNDHMQSQENMTYPKPVTDDIIERAVTENQSKEFAPEFDHSYSVSEQQADKLVNSHASESSYIKRDEIINTEQPCNIGETDMICYETPENIDLSQERNAITEISNEVPQSKIDVPNVHDSRGNKKTEPSDYTSSVISGSNIPINETFVKISTSLSNEDEIKCIIKELIAQVDKLSDSWIYDDSGNSTINSTNFSFAAAIENFVPTTSKSVADKENQLYTSSSDDNLAKGSKKRKIKPPIRSPFNFRQRGKMENSKLSTKSLKSLSVPQIKSVTTDKDLIIKSIFSKTDGKEDENTENSMAKIISSIVDSITDEEVANSDMLPNESSPSQLSKAQRIELSNDELTDLNTRLNASIAPQTRRSKMIAASHKTSNETDTTQSNVVIVCSGDSSSNLSSILKKRKSSGPLPPAKIRRVTFASPLIHEVVIESCSESRGIETITMNRLQNLTKKRKKILQEKNKTEKGSPVLLPVPVVSEDVPSSSEYQDSDVLDFSDLPVSPALINCPDDVSNILKDLTSPSWIRGLESLLFSKNIKTIGDVCKLNIHQVKALPFKSPKVSTLHKALMAYINVTQDATLEKFKTIDDGSFVMDAAACSSSISEESKTEKPEITDDDKSKLLEETLKDILKKDQLKELPMNLLGQLVEACGKAITEKSEKKF